MPSFTSLLKSSRLSQQFDKKDVKMQNSNAEKEPFSKRAFFRRLLKKPESKSPSTNQPQKDGMLPVKPASPSSERPTPSPSPNSELPSSPMHSDKPLPPPPPESTADPAPPLLRPSVKLDRIIAPLALIDLQRLFSGAPHFFARSEGHGTGAPHPSVAYPYNEELEIRDLSDHVMIQDEAWACVTAWPHVTCQDAGAERQEPPTPNFVPRCRERPSMLSIQGLERGTVGFQAALELGVADAMQNPEEDVHNAKVIAEHRWRFLNSKEGARPLTDTALIERLLNVSESYHERAAQQAGHPIALYTDLFTQILHPPSRVTDADDPYSLQVQVEALVSVLCEKHVWFDFSKVEWRIRLGLLLWAPSSDLDYEVEVDGEVVDEPSTQKYWLLLQIILSCELLLRLDMVSKGVDAGEQNVTPEEISRFEKNATPSVRWSLILARQWLENIRIQKIKPIAVIEEKPATGWLSSFAGATQPETAVKESINDLKFEGRHQVRQIRGLVHFARKISWPNVDAIVGKVSANGILITESTENSPIGTPRSVSTQRSSYFASDRPGLRRALSSINDRMSAIVHPAGWLSNSYLSGLILPGESLSHFLISTLLENDQEAVSKLGEEANLYGGFVYQDKSFWSTSCIVGRILAAGKNAKECMGWISSEVVPRGVREVWVDIDVETVDDSVSEKKEKRPRILRKATVEQRGHILGGADISSSLPGDFILPSDESSETALSVKFLSLDLFATEDSVSTTPTKETATPLSESTEVSEVPKIKLYSAMMRFTMQVEGEAMKEINISLTNDVYFLTAHPCVPSQNSLPHSPISPSFQASNGYKASEHAGHPLHKAFTYTKIPLSQILAMPGSSSFSTFLSPSVTHFSTHTSSSGIPTVLVIDCTDSTMDIFPPAPKHASSFGSDLEMLARALCSERGWNALVSRRGRGCLACAVREAGAVGWKVVLRVV